MMKYVTSSSVAPSIPSNRHRSQTKSIEVQPEVLNSLQVQMFEVLTTSNISDY